MGHRIPVLAADRVVHFAGRTTFAEALEATLSQQWIIVSPRVTIRLHRTLPLDLRLDSDGTSVTVTATPRYWSGAFLGMQVEVASPEAAEVIKSQLAGLRRTLAEFPEDEEPAADEAGSNFFGSSTSEIPVYSEGGLGGSGNSAGSGSERDLPSVRNTSGRSSLSSAFKEPTSQRVVQLPPNTAGSSLGTRSHGPGSTTTTSKGAVRDRSSDFIEEPTQPGVQFAAAGAAFGMLASQMTEVSQHGLSQAWGVTDDGIWNQVFQGVTSKTPGGTSTAAMEGEFVALDLAEVASVPLYLSARLLLMPDDVRLYTLLMALSLRETTCKVTLEHEGDSGQVLLRRGMLVWIDPPGVDSDQMLGELLLQSGLVTGAQLSEAVGLAQSEGESLGVKLYEKGWLTLDVLNERLRELREALVLTLLERAQAGSFRIEAGIESSKRRDPVRVNLVTVLAAYIRRRIFASDQTTLARILEPFQDRFPRYRENLTFPKEAVGITASEQLLIDSAFMGRAPLGSLLEEEATCSKECMALMILLHHLGYLDWLEESLTADGAASVEAYLERRLKNLRTMGHFERLDVHWATPPSRLELGMRMVVNRFGPLSHLARHSSASARLCAQIVSLCQESYGALLDPESRRKHRVSRYGESKMQYAARFLARQAIQLHDKSVGVPAIQMLESAIDLMAEEEWISLLEQWKATPTES